MRSPNSFSSSGLRALTSVNNDSTRRWGLDVETGDPEHDLRTTCYSAAFRREFAGPLS